MIWTMAMDRILRTGWRSGLSSHEIARQLTVLGVEVTSAAVRNRRPDLGLKQRSTEVLAVKQKGKASNHKPNGTARAPGLAPGSTPRPWEQRLVGQCAFPVGDGDEGLIACCGPVSPGSKRPYCPFHLELSIGVRHVA